jgi:hypothetical protein
MTGVMPAAGGCTTILWSVLGGGSTPPRRAKVSLSELSLGWTCSGGGVAGPGGRSGTGCGFGKEGGVTCALETGAPVSAMPTIVKIIKAAAIRVIAASRSTGSEARRIGASPGSVLNAEATRPVALSNHAAMRGRDLCHQRSPRDGRPPRAQFH